VATLVLSVTPKEMVSPISGPASVEVNQTITLTNPTVGGAWSVTPSPIAAINSGGTLTGLSNGAATVAYTIPNTLCGSDTAFYKVLVKAPEVFIPNLFSPNGDQSNPRFYIRGIASAYSAVQLFVFDSWGTKIFESPSGGLLNDPNIGWDGQYKGKPQPAGAYVYVAKLTAVSGETITKKGIINLIR